MDGWIRALAQTADIFRVGWPGIPSEAVSGDDDNVLSE